MATVCLAREIATSNIVAVLVLEPPLTRDAGSVRRFLRSAQLGAGSGHPYVAPVEDYGQEQDICYMVTGFGPQGVTLAELEHRSGVVPPAQAAWISSCIASALEAAAAFGGIPFHGALSPAGIIITASGDAQVTGFGTAPASGAIDRALGEQAAAYAAPEQLDGRGVDMRSDLYTLGAILYEMLTGRVPLVSEVRSFLTFSGSVQTERFLEKIPAQLRPVISGLVRWNPDERFAAPGDVLQALATAGFPPPQRPMSDAVGPGREHGPVLDELERPERAAAPVHMVGMEQLYAQEQKGTASQPEETAPLTGGVGRAEIPLPEEGLTWEVAGPTEQVVTTLLDAVSTAVPGWRKARRWMVPLAAGIVVAAVVGYLVIARPFSHSSTGPGGTATKPSGSQTVDMGTLNVTSVPAGARVLVDGVDTGKVTPVTLSAMVPGSHGIALQLAGYEEDHRTVAVSAGATSTVQMSLAKRPDATGSSTVPTKPPATSEPVQAATTLRVTSSPAGAAIILDARESGRQTPATLTVAAGSHTVGLRLTGYDMVTRRVNVIKGKQTLVSIPLSKAAPVVMGSLRIESVPAGAAIRIDGKTVAGRTPLTTAVTLGHHAIQVTLSGYEPWSRTGVDVVKGIQTVIVARLAPLPVDLSFTSRTGGFGFVYPSTWQVLEKPDTTEPFVQVEARSLEGPFVRVLVIPLNGASLQTYLADLRSTLQNSSGLVITASGVRVVNGIAYEHLVTVRAGSQTEYCLLQSAGSVYQLECTAGMALLASSARGFQTILGSFFTAP